MLFQCLNLNELFGTAFTSALSSAPVDSYCNSIRPNATANLRNSQRTGSHWGQCMLCRCSGTLHTASRRAACCEGTFLLYSYLENRMHEVRWNRARKRRSVYIGDEYEAFTPKPTRTTNKHDRSTGNPRSRFRNNRKSNSYDGATENRCLPQLFHRCCRQSWLTSPSLMLATDPRPLVDALRQQKKERQFSPAYASPRKKKPTSEGLLR